MRKKKIYTRSLRKECNLKMDFKRIENMKKIRPGSKPKFQSLLYLVEHIYKVSEVMFTKLVKLIEAKNSKNDNQNEWIKLIDDEDCPIIQKQFMKLLNKFRDFQVTYTELQGLNSYETILNEIMDIFKEFIQITSPILEKMFKKCKNKQHVAYTVYPYQYLIHEDVKICSEIQKFAIALKSLFNNFDLKLGSADFQEKKDQIIEILSSFFTAVHKKEKIHIFKKKDGDSVRKNVNPEIEHLNNTYSSTNVIYTSTHQPTNTFLKNKISLIHNADYDRHTPPNMMIYNSTFQPTTTFFVTLNDDTNNVVSDLYTTSIWIILVLVILGFTSLTVFGFVFICRFFKEKKKLRTEHKVKGIKLNES